MPKICKGPLVKAKDGYPLCDDLKYGAQSGQSLAWIRPGYIHRLYSILSTIRLVLVIFFFYDTSLLEVSYIFFSLLASLHVTSTKGLSKSKLKPKYFPVNGL